MTRAFVSIGSNINPAENTIRAIRMLDCEVGILNISTVYLTQPEDRPDEESFYNCVVSIDTSIPPVDLKYRVLRRIELELGRIRGTDRYAARTIDLDLILYGEVVMQTDELELPDADILRRPFLAIPLKELAPGLILPGSGLRIDPVAVSLSDHTMQPLSNFTEQLRKDILHGRIK